MATWQHIVRKLTKQHAIAGTPAASVMHEAIIALVPARFARHRDALLTIDWSHDTNATTTWLQSLLTSSPPPSELPAFWFRVTDLEDPESLIHVAACPGFDERPSQSDWASEVHWPAEAINPADTSAFETTLPSLSRIREILLTTDLPRSTTNTRYPAFALQPAWHGLPAILAMLVTRDALTTIDRSLVLQTRPWRGVGFGYADGDLYITGILARDGWCAPGKPFRHPLPPPPPLVKLHDNPLLDLNSLHFSPSAYLASGLDLHARATDGRTPLMRALDGYAGPADFDTAMEMIRRGADINATAPGHIAPFYYFLNQPPAQMQFALDHGGDVTLAHDRLGSPLLSACSHGAVTANIKMLLAAGANVHATTRHGDTPLMVFMESGVSTYKQTVLNALRAIRALLRRGVNINQPNHSGETPLLRCLMHISAQQDHSKPVTPTHYAPIFHYLLRCGANPNAQAEYNRIYNMPTGGTPLMYGVYANGWLHHLLLKHGADPSLRCDQGRSAIDYLETAIKRAKPDELPILHSLHAGMLTAR